MFLSEERRVESQREAPTLLEAIVDVRVLLKALCQRLPDTSVVVRVDMLFDL